jgi:hypothetical protein
LRWRSDTAAPMSLQKQKPAERTPTKLLLKKRYAQIHGHVKKFLRERQKN